MTESVSVSQVNGAEYTWSGVGSTNTWDGALLAPRQWVNDYDAAFTVGIASTLSFSELETAGVGISPSEAFAAAESYSKNSAPNFIETAVVVRGGSYAWGSASITWATTAETWVSTVGTTKNVGQASYETVGATEAFGRAASFALSFSDGWSQFDTVAKTVNPVFFETLATVDACVVSAILFLNFSESWNTAEVVVNNYGQNLAEVWSQSEGSMRLYGKVLAESWTNIELYDDVVGFNPNFAESFAVVESRVANYGQSFSEAVAVAEQQVSNYGASYAEAVALSEFNTLATGKAVQEAIATVEVSAVAFGRNVAELLTVAELYDDVTGFNRQVGEALTLVESFGRVATFNKALAEGVALTEAFAKALSLPKGEAFSVGDLMRRNAGVTVSDILIRGDDISVDDFAATLVAGAPAGFAPFKHFMEGDHDYQKAVIKATFQANGPNSGRVKEMKAVIDVPDVDDSGTTAVPTGGLAVYFSRQFYTVPEVVVSLKGGTVMARPRVTGIQVDHFTVELIDANGTSVAGNIGWNAQGY